MAAIAAVVAATGCGGSDTGGDIGRQWVAAVDAEEWVAACALMADAGSDCASGLAETERGEVGYFEIVESGGTSKVDLQAIFVR